MSHSAKPIAFGLRATVWLATVWLGTVWLGSLWLAGCESRRATGTERANTQAHAREDAQEDEGKRATSDVVELSPEAVARSGIRIAQVEGIAAKGRLHVPAEVQAEPDREAHISSVVAGQIARVLTSVGDRVEAGQTLGIIRSIALGEARAQGARARANVEVAQANFRRQEELRREGIGAERQYLEAQAELRRAEAEQSAADRALEVYGRGGTGSEVALKSPISGRVIARHATIGEVVAPSDVLFEVTDISEVWAVGRVYQQQAGRVHEGAPATLTLQSHPGRLFSGKLDYVAPALDERTRTLPVRMTLANPDGVLRPGSFGTLSIDPSDPSEERVPTVEASGLQRLADQTVLFVPTEVPGRYRAVSVQVTTRSGKYAQIRSTLALGDPYVADGAFVLKSELRRSELGEGHEH